MQTVTDPIADMLTRIRNAVAVNHEQVMVPHSGLKMALAELLVREHYLVAATPSKETPGMIEITLRTSEQSSKLRELQRLSKPGRRLYANVKTIPVVRRGRSLVVLSTSQGLLSAKEARKLGIGGEVICMVG